MFRSRRVANSFQFSASGVRHGLTMAGATVIAGGLDYLYNVLTGRLLNPVEFGVLISITAILQVAVHLTNVIRNVVAYYTADMTGRAEPADRVTAFLRGAWSRAGRWGILAMVAFAALSPVASPLLKLQTWLPLGAASLALLLLFLRPVTDGALQGLQRFGGLATVQVSQALLRLVFAGLLIWVGWQAFGAILALPLASGAALLVAFYFLRRPAAANAARSGTPVAPAPEAAGLIGEPIVSRRYFLQTLVGLLAFALMTNMDAVIVKLAFDPDVAGNYAPVVTLGKINLFVPLAMGMVLFPKTTQRQASGRQTRPVLLLALLLAFVPGMMLTAVYFAFPAVLVRTVFGSAYREPGAVLGLIGLATTLFAMLNIWLNYALSLRRPAFVAALALVVVAQLGGMIVFHASLVEIAATMVAAGLLGNLAALVTVRSNRGSQYPAHPG